MSSLSDLEVARIVEYGEADGFIDMFAAAPPELGCRIERLGSAIALIMPTLPITLFNRVLCLGLDEPVEESTIIDITRLYTQAGVATHAVHLAPIFKPPQLTNWLVKHGYKQADNWVKMIRLPEPSITVLTSLRIERITPDRALDFAQVAAQSFGMPPFIIPWLAALVGRVGWQHFVAYDDALPVAAGAIYVQDGIGWLGIGGTLPSHRQRGAQGAIMARRIQAAAEAGCKCVITETGEDRPNHPNPSYHNMLRTGFDLAYKRINYVYKP
jgi:hypothetical protein